MRRQHDCLHLTNYKDIVKKDINRDGVERKNRIIFAWMWKPEDEFRSCARKTHVSIHVCIHTLRWEPYVTLCPASSRTFLASSVQFSSVQSFSHVWIFVTPWTTARQASVSITNSQSLLKFMSIESVMPSKHLILCRPLLLLPSIFPSIKGNGSRSVVSDSSWPHGLQSTRLLHQ